jgi:hypothetical protein
MTQEWRVREGETGNQDFTLTDENGAYNGDGGTLSLIMTDRRGGVVNTSGKVAWIDDAAGTVRVNCAVGDLTVERSPYDVTFIVTLGSGTYAFPQAGPMKWKVWR